MDQSIAKEYFYSNKIKNLPEPIKVEDTASQNDFFLTYQKIMIVWMFFNLSLRQKRE